MKILTTLILLMASSAIALGQTPGIGEYLDGQVSDFEKKICTLAEAMPAEAYPFAPKNGEFRGVRTFAEQVKHVAATNFVFAHALLEDPVTLTKAEMLAGPAALTNKAEILAYLKQSFALAHKGVKAVTDGNFKTPVLNPLIGTKMSRLGVASLIVSHGFDHYGQMVVYARMNGIVPPDSQPAKK